jgi:tetratricopeptide (TPR) repeat protein
MLVVLALGVSMFAFGVLFTRGGPVEPAPPVGRAPLTQVPETANGAGLVDVISTLQQRLRRLPADHEGWATLGTAYVQQAAITGDPTYYPKAEGALTRSLRIEPKDNAAALTGQAALAAARHDFAAARNFALDAQAINPYSAANQGILTDALQQLGRYGQARTELQGMLDLKPGVSSFTRASYAYELSGQTGPAKMALRRALELANTASDEAFCLYYLGELAWNSGDLAEAERLYTQGLRSDATYTPLLAGLAKVAAARGDLDTAVARYEKVVQRLPVPSHLIAYADLLRSMDRGEEAARQEAVVAATQALFEEQGASVELEIALFEADRGRSKSALRAARSAWQGERSIEAADAFAWALHTNGRDREALRYAEKAARLGTKSALLAYHRGIIEMSLAQDDAASKSLRRALELNPHFSPLLAPRAVTALESLRSR